MSKTEYPDDWDTRRKEVYRRDRYTCQNCGRRGGAHGNVELHAHHIVPKSAGGTDELSNLKTLCKDCHRAVHTSATAPTSESPIRSHGFLRAFKADVFAIVVYVVMAAFYAAGFDWIGMVGLVGDIAPFVMAVWPTKHARNWALGEYDD